MALSEKLKQDLRNPWLRGILAVVAVTVTVNVGFIIYSFRSPPNLVVADYYEKGKTYFHEERERELAAKTAWRLQLLTPETPRLNQAQTYRLYLIDHGGTPVDSARVTLMAYRLDDARHDFQNELPHVDVGTFAGEVTFPLPGHWDLIAQVRSGDRSFDTAQRIFVHE